MLEGVDTAQKDDLLFDSLGESEQKYQVLFEQSNDAIFIYDMEGRFLDVNPQSCERFGYTLISLFK